MISRKKCDSLGANSILVFIYKGTDKQKPMSRKQIIIQGDTEVTGRRLLGRRLLYAGAVATTGGYWTSTATINLTANLYVKGSKDPLWTSESRW